MSRTHRWIGGAAMCGVLAASMPFASQQAAQLPAGTDKAAFAVLELGTQTIVAQARPDVLASPMAPGSVLKIATLVTALEAHVIDGATTVMCRRTMSIDGHTLTCVHPDLHRALTPAEALAYSCNTFFAMVAQRISRPAFDAVLVRMGLPPLAPQATVVSGALGLDGIRVAPRVLLDAFVRVAGPAPSLQLSEPVRSMLVDGLRKAAEFGTASAFAAARMTALAKTGTAPMPGGGYHGIVVAVTPADRPTHAVVVVVPGGAGADAAAVAVDVLRRYGLSPANGPVPTVAAGTGRGVAPVPAGMVRIGVTRRNGRGYDTVSIPTETYVSRVVAGERLAGAPPAALEALAIAVRTYAMANRDRHAADGFDLCDLTHCQVMGRPDARSDSAAQATEGLVLWEGPRLATVYFSSSCGGHTEVPSHVWNGARDASYLPARPDPACGGEPSWTTEMSEPQARLVLGAAGLRGSSVRGLSVVARYPSGRVATLHADGFVPEQLDAGVFFRTSGQTLGWQVIKSTLFDVRRTATGFAFAGHGLGHGVGLCVRGASTRAAAGATRDAILEAYFPGLAVRRFDVKVPRSTSTDVRVRMPESDREFAGEVHDVAAHALDSFARTLKMTPPPVVELHFYPTVEAFTRGAGMPWWVAARTVGSRVDFQPRDALRKRGVLDSTIRHEIVHVLIDASLKGRPAWVREGLAMVVSGEYQGRGKQPPAACPTDADLLNSRSAEQWRRWYEAAGACAAAALAAGQRWHDLR